MATNMFETREIEYGDYIIAGKITRFHAVRDNAHVRKPRRQYSTWFPITDSDGDVLLNVDLVGAFDQSLRDFLPMIDAVTDALYNSIEDGLTRSVNLMSLKVALIDNPATARVEMTEFGIGLDGRLFVELRCW